MVFDLDGTLLDTIADIGAAMNTALKMAGLPVHPTEAYRGMVGWGLRRLAEAAVPADYADDGDMGEIYANLVAAYQSNPVVFTKPYAGVVELLQELRENGYTLGILSNKSHELVVSIVERCLPAEIFREVRGVGPKTPHKPDPTGVREVLRILESNPEETLFVGDSALDMKTALAAGAVPVGVSWGFRPVAELKDAGAAFIIDNPHEIHNIIASKNS